MMGKDSNHQTKRMTIKRQKNKRRTNSDLETDHMVSKQLELWEGTRHSWTVFCEMHWHDI